MHKIYTTGIKTRKCLIINIFIFCSQHKKRFYRMMIIIKKSLINTKSIGNQDYQTRWQNAFKRENYEKQDIIKNDIANKDIVSMQIIPN